MAKAKKITKSELETLREFASKQSNIYNQIGALEHRKDKFLNELQNLDEESKGFISSINEKYGPINIDIDSGMYTEL